MKVKVDSELCISCGVCVSMVPDVFSWDEEDKATAIEEEVPTDLIEDVQDALESCPTEAIQEC
ncbi:MAG TPA: ferredoxin [Clostridia bacterium]|nr:ferredoxin [Clostridia bacterium]